MNWRISKKSIWKEFSIFSWHVLEVHFWKTKECFASTQTNFRSLIEQREYSFVSTSCRCTHDVLRTERFLSSCIERCTAGLFFVLLESTKFIWKKLYVWVMHNLHNKCYIVRSMIESSAVCRKVSSTLYYYEFISLLMEG